jgi:thymidylate kinase
MSEFETYRYPPRVVVVEGLDGTGKTTTVHALVGLAGGVDVTHLVMEAMGSSRESAMQSPSLQMRFHFWLSVNFLASEYAEAAIAGGRMAIIDSYFFRTLACHSVLGITADQIGSLRGAMRPHRAVLLTAPEIILASRMGQRSGKPHEPHWKTELNAKSSEVLDAYRMYGLLEIDTSLGTPDRVAEQILSDPRAEDFQFDLN